MSQSWLSKVTIPAFAFVSVSTAFEHVSANFDHRFRERETVAAVAGWHDSSGVFVHPRESSDNPSMNAFCRVAASLRLRPFAIFLADILLRAADFSSRTSALVQCRRFEFLLAMYGFLPI